MQRRLTFSALMGLAMLLLGTAPAVAQDLGDLLSGRAGRTVHVTGEGTVRVEPDQATIRFGVVTQAQDPEAAREQNAEAAKNALNAVRDLGVPERKIRLETLRLEPVYEYDDQRRTREIVAYEAVRTMVVELDDLEMLPTLVARVVQQGANRLLGLEYGLENRTQARNQALQEAVKDAQAKAELLANTLDEEIGRVVQIEEQHVDFPRPVIEMSTRGVETAQDAAAPEPEAYAAGEIEVRALVRVVFALE